MPRPVSADGAEGAATTSEEMVTDAAQEATPVGSKTTSAPSDDTSEGSNEELDDASDLDFNDNCTVSYEPMSLGPGFDDFFDEGHSSILVRKEYRDMFKHISTLRQNDRKRGVVITGTPGIENQIFSISYSSKESSMDNARHTSILPPLY
ncbi:hypothetical protein M378DRAFT_998213 [Amanita muscaria Koide BX008]|uniref:Uncharacterized protein n=1 Tax=Amanita muscaria (strain Koide BX008) TaxID=946122 RepID=A0A0C2WS99_AMAMK|nr:hypothetical protein M378DRAFT_998213 [Amanita muscaria Koide BX008]